MSLYEVVLTAGTTINMPQPARAAASAAAKTGGAAGTTTSSMGQQTFRATLSGNEEVPPINTQATGSATFTVTTDENDMSYRMLTVVTLFQSKATTTGPIKNGILSQGTITSANLEGPLKGKQISDLEPIPKIDIYLA